MNTKRLYKILDDNTIDEIDVVISDAKDVYDKEIKLSQNIYYKDALASMANDFIFSKFLGYFVFYFVASLVLSGFDILGSIIDAFIFTLLFVVFIKLFTSYYGNKYNRLITLHRFSGSHNKVFDSYLRKHDFYKLEYTNNNESLIYDRDLELKKILDFKSSNPNYKYKNS